MKTYKCPKCGGSDHYLSKRNIQIGRGVFHRGEFKILPVCKQCDELMMIFHGENNLVNKIGRYGLISLGAVIALILVVNIVNSILA